MPLRGDEAQPRIGDPARVSPAEKWRVLELRLWLSNLWAPKYHWEPRGLENRAYHPPVHSDTAGDLENLGIGGQRFAMSLGYGCSGLVLRCVADYHSLSGVSWSSKRDVNGL